MTEEQENVKEAMEAEGDANAKGGHKTKTLYIWGLDKSLTQIVVKEEFTKFAQVTRVTIIKDKSTGTSKGFGYVECETPEDATKAMKEMDGRVIGENPVRIKYSFSETPDWLKYLDSKGDLGERPTRQSRGQDGFSRGRGRGRFSGRGREHPGEDSGRGGFDFGRYDGGGREPPSDYFPYETGTPGRLDNYERRPPSDDPYKRRPHDDPYERRPMDVPYDRRPPLDEPLERRPLRPREDPFERRPREDPYDTSHPPPAGRAPIDNSYDERRLPPRRAAGEPYGGGREDIYNSAGKRDVYQERRDLYRPSDREGYMEPNSGRDQPRGRSPDPLRLPPVNYRARSPIDRSDDIVGDRDRYERRPVRERLPPSNYYDSNRDTYSPPPLHADEVRRVPEANPAVSDYRPAYAHEPIRESAGRPLYEGSYSERLPTKRAPPEHFGGRVPERRPDIYNDPYATVDSRK